MKKFIGLLLAVLTFTATFSGCAIFGESKNDGTLKVYCPDGAPAIAIAQMLGDNQIGGQPAEFKIVSSTQITNFVQKRNAVADVAILPLNAAVKICGTGDDYQMVSVLTHGNLYIVSDKAISLSDLVGKKVGVIGQGLVPDLTLKAVLNKNGIPFEASPDAIDGKVALFYYGSGEELMPAMRQNKIKIGLLPEPAATKIVTKLDTKYTCRLDLGELYDAQAGGYPQAVMVVKKSLSQDIVTALINMVKNSIDYALDDANATSVVNSVNDHLEDGVVASLDSFVTAEVIDRCGIYYQDALSARNSIDDYLTAIGMQKTSDNFIYGLN